MNQPLNTLNLEVDIAFTGFVPDRLKANLDEETKGFLTNLDIWSLTIKSWISYIRNDYNLFCPSLVRTNNFLSMGLIFSDDFFIKDMNRRWRKHNTSTDVLSFPALDEDLLLPPNEFVELGDICLSVETALKQSKIHNHSLIHELRWLVSHGLLHLLGWDHPSSTSLDRMLAVQEKLIKTTEHFTFKKSSINF